MIPYIEGQDKEEFRQFTNAIGSKFKGYKYYPDLVLRNRKIDKKVHLGIPINPKTYQDNKNLDLSQMVSGYSLDDIPE